MGDALRWDHGSVVQMGRIPILTGNAAGVMAVWTGLMMSWLVVVSGSEWRMCMFSAVDAHLAVQGLNEIQIAGVNFGYMRYICLFLVLCTAPS